MKPIAILGCGPSGLLAAWAVALQQRPFVIFSVPKKSGLGGAQYLHKPIDGLTDDDMAHMVTYRMEGDPVVYFEKAYGSMPDYQFNSDWWKPENQEPAWNLIAYYDFLWEQFSPAINPESVTAQWLLEHIDDFEMVVSTIPLGAICINNSMESPPYPHYFRMAPIRIKTEALNPNIPDGEIWYDGTKDFSWYRQSHVFGHGNTEWGPTAPEKLPHKDLINGKKPTNTNCDCWPNVLKVGRYGRWAKSEHTHDAFQHTMDALNERYGAKLTLF